MNIENLKLYFENPAPELDLQTIDDALIRHTEEMGVERKPAAIHLIYRDSEMKMVAGLKGRTCYGWLSILQLWVDKSLRGLGIGTQLMQEAERIAIERGCTRAHTDSYSYQAPEFYLKLGYEVFGELRDCPEGHNKFYLKKDLV